MSKNVPPRLLLVDDEEVFLLLASMVLERAGFAVTSVAESPRALTLIEQGLRPDVLLLDYRMPELSGPELLKKVRAAGVTAPAVLVSAVHDVERKCRQHGFDAAVAKPFSAKGLLDTVNRLIEPHSEGKSA